jgi:hypothetical protein
VKRVLLIVIDGCTPTVLGPAIERRDLPLFAELTAGGRLALDCVSIFPSITPAATASIVTGQYPAGHGISGMSWWNPNTGEVSYYGSDMWTVFRRGAGDVVRDFLLHLNGDRLKAPTMFQLTERQHKQAACFNYIIFRGDVTHQATQPWVLRLLPSIGDGVAVHGPSWLCLGDFVSTSGRKRSFDAPGGVLHRFGLDDQATEEFLKDVTDVAALPEFTVAYFADYDFESHEKGAGEALTVLRRLDDRLHSIFEAWGGINRVLDHVAVVVTADHGHSDIGRDKDCAIDLTELLSNHRCGDPLKGWRDEDDVLVCPNMRSAELFYRRSERDINRRLADDLLADKRIDQVIWSDHEFGSHGALHVVTNDRGELSARRAPDTGDALTDEYGGRWTITGDLSALDMRVHGRGVQYGAYPNALERLANGVAFPRTGRLWVTARPTYEFAVSGQSVHHGGSSHGTLHDLDSRVPLLVAGTARDVRWRATPRIVDIVPLCAELLNLEFEWRVGAAR